MLLEPVLNVAVGPRSASVALGSSCSRWRRAFPFAAEPPTPAPMRRLLPAALVFLALGPLPGAALRFPVPDLRSEEHTSELQSLMRISYAVFCLKKKKKYQTQ